MTASITVNATPVASAWAAPWSAGASAGGGGASLAATVSGLTPLANRKSTASNLWCANATDAVGFLVKSAAVRPAVIASGATTTPPTTNTLGMDASLWSACVAPQCGPTNRSYVRGACTAVQGGPAGDQWGAFRGTLPGPPSALSGANCSLLSIDPLVSTGGTWSHWIACRYNATGTQSLCLNVTVAAATAELQAGDGDAALVAAPATAWPPGAVNGTLTLTLANNGTATGTLSVSATGCCVAASDGGACGGGAAPVTGPSPPPALVVAPGATAAFAVVVTGDTLGAYGRCTFTVSVDGVAKSAQVSSFFYAPPAGAPPLTPPTTTTPAPPPPPTTTTTTPVASPTATATPTPSAVATLPPPPPPPTFTPLLTFTATFPSLAATAATPTFQTRYRTAVAAAAGVPLASVRVVAASPGVTIATATGVTLTTEVTFPAATSSTAAEAFGASLDVTNGGVLSAAGACVLRGGIGPRASHHHHPYSFHLPLLFPSSTTRPHPHHRLRHRHRGLCDARHPVPSSSSAAAHHNCPCPRLSVRPARLLGARHPHPTVRMSVRLGVGHDSAAGE